jgi:hypothetical protein
MVCRWLSVLMAIKALSSGEANDLDEIIQATA